MANSPQGVLVECREHDVKVVALHVTDSLGKWHQLIVPIARLTEEAFEDGFAWSLPRLATGRSQVADVLLLPQPSTAFIAPLADTPSLSILCSMHDPLTREELPEDPRAIALKAERFAKDSGVADEVLIGLGLEFFLFPRSPQQTQPGHDRRLAEEPGDWGWAANRGSPSSPGQLLDDDFRSQLMQALGECGVPVASHGPSDNDGCKSRLDLGESGLVASADHVMITKHLVRQLAARWGKSATFMPLPEAGRQPASMPTQLALMRGSHCALSGSGYAGLSEAGLHAIGGILKHARSITALTNSTTNSYSRFGLGPATNQPSIGPQVAYSQSDLRAAIRVPNHRVGKHKCLEFQVPDALCNPYLAFTALLMAAIDGVHNKLHPGPALRADRYGLDQSLATEGQPMPSSLSASLSALEEDAEFLLRGDVMSPELLQAWIAHKRLVDIEALRQQPHPQEIAAYYDA